MLGFDSRAAMTPGGMADGFGNLGAALLLAPQMHRRDQQEVARFQAEQQARRDQLAQALQIAQMQDARQGQRWDAMKQWHDGEIQRQQANDNARNAIGASNSAREWAGTLGQGALNLAGVLGLDASKAPKSKYGEYKPDLYNTTETIDPDSGKLIRTKSLKTQDQIDQERALYNRATVGAALDGKAPPTDAPTGVAANKARSAQARADQMTQGLAAAPGKPTPTPSTSGVGESMPADASAPAGPVAGGQPSTATAPTLQMGHLRSKVADGTFPDLDAAYQDATSRGYVVQPDQQ